MTYEKSFKEEAVRLSDEIGVKKAAEQLGVPYYTLADWRQQRKRYSAQAYVGSGHKRVSTDPKEQELYVGRTKNLRQRLYNNHLHGPVTNARLKKYLVEDDGEPEVKDLEAAKKYLKDFCYLQFVVEDDIMKRGRLEGLLSYLFHVRYMYEEH